MFRVGYQMFMLCPTGCTSEDVESFANQLFASLYIECLVHGNFDSEVSGSTLGFRARLNAYPGICSTYQYSNFWIVTVRSAESSGVNC